MPLRDHFRSPVNDTHSWDEVHGQWPGEIVRHLTTILPAGFRAAPKVHLGSPFEVDVSTYDLDSRDPDTDADSGDAGTGYVDRLVTHPHRRSGPVGTGRVRGAHLRRGEGPATGRRHRNRQPVEQRPSGHPRAVRRQGGVPAATGRLRFAGRSGERSAGEPLRPPAEPARPRRSRAGTTTPYLYAVTLRSRKPPKRRQLLDAWFYPMIVGQPLPTLPIWLTPDLRVMLPLETSYEETCRILGIA